MEEEGRLAQIRLDGRTTVHHRLYGSVVGFGVDGGVSDPDAIFLDLRQELSQILKIGKIWLVCRYAVVGVAGKTSHGRQLIHDALMRLVPSHNGINALSDCEREHREHDRYQR